MQLIVLGLGTLGVSVLFLLKQLKSLFKNDKLLLQGFESDRGFQPIFLPDFPLKSKDSLPVFPVAIEDDKLLQEELKSGKMPHLDFCSHDIISSTIRGYKLNPSLGFLGCVQKYPNLKRLLADLIASATNLQKGKEKIALIAEVGFSGGGTNRAVSRVQEDSAYDILTSSSGEGLKVSLIDFKILPLYTALDKSSRISHANTYAFLKEMGAFEKGAERSLLTPVGEGERYNPRFLNKKVYLISDIGEGTVTPPMLTSTLARVIDWLSTEIGDRWRGLEPNLEESLPEHDLPSCNFLGASSLFLPNEEENIYRALSVVISLFREFLRKGKDSENRKMAQRILRTKKLSGEEIYAKIEKRWDFPLDLLKNYEVGEDPYSEVENLEKIHNKLKDSLSAKFVDLKSIQEVVEEEVRVNFKEACEECIANPELFWGMVREVAQHMSRICEGEIKTLQRNIEVEKKVHERYKKLAEQHKNWIANYRRWWFLKRLINRKKFRKAPSCYKFCLVNALSAQIKGEILRTAVEALQKTRIFRERNLREIDKILEVLSKIRDEVKENIKALQTTDFAYRGLGISLRKAEDFQVRFEEIQIIEEAKKQLLPRWKGKVKELFNEPTRLLNWFIREAHDLLQKEEKLVSEDITELLNKREDREKIIREWIRKSKEMLATNPHSHSGKGAPGCIVALPRGSSNPLSDLIVRLLPELQIDAKIRIVPHRSSGEMVILRMEIGRALESIPLVKKFEKIYHSLTIKERAQRHIEPLFIFFPEIIHRDPKRFEVMAKVAGVFSDGLYKSGSGEKSKVTDTREFFSNYKNAVDVASQFVYFIKEKGFTRTKEELEKFQEEDNFKEVAEKLLTEVAELAILYHQEV